jgi:hypothetical protein
MDIDNLVHMANQIGEFFSAFPDQEEAKSGIATHIHKFWEPRMRNLILDGIDQQTFADIVALGAASLGTTWRMPCGQKLPRVRLDQNQS